MKTKPPRWWRILCRQFGWMFLASFLLVTVGSGFNGFHITIWSGLGIILVILSLEAMELDSGYQFSYGSPFDKEGPTP